MRKKEIYTYLILGIIVIIIIGAIFLLRGDNLLTDEKLAICIGENSELYIQLGCSACKTQEEMFGENYVHLNIIDCVYETDKCIENDIKATPTWIINGQSSVGVQSIEELKKLTAC